VTYTTDIVNVVHTVLLLCYYVCHFSPKQLLVTLPSLSVIYLSLCETNTPRWSDKFHPHLCTNWCLQIFVLSTYTSRFEHSVLKSVSSTRCCKRVSWCGRLSHDTPAANGDAPIAGYLLKNW